MSALATTFTGMYLTTNTVTWAAAAIHRPKLDIRVVAVLIWGESLPYIVGQQNKDSNASRRLRVEVAIQLLSSGSPCS